MTPQVMSAEERRLIASVDKEILSADPKRLKELQELDLQTQMSGMSFYENVVNSGTLVKATSPRRS